MNTTSPEDSGDDGPSFVPWIIKVPASTVDQPWPERVPPLPSTEPRRWSFPSHDLHGMLAHLVDEWGTAGVVGKLLEAVPPEQVDAVIAVARRDSGHRLAEREEYRLVGIGQRRTPAPPRRAPRPGVPTMDLLETDDGRGVWWVLLPLGIIGVLVMVFAFAR